MKALPTLDDGDFAGKRVLVRVDLNVPLEGGKVSDATRIERVVPTIAELAEKGARVILLSHLGRPNGPDPALSLKTVVAPLAAALARPVAFAADCIGPSADKAVKALTAGAVVLLENTRFHAGEERNAPAFVAALAALGDMYVNDAFSAAHRAHASTEGLAHVLPSFAGRALQAEIVALDAVLGASQRPVVAIVGGAKISTKIALLENLVARVEALIIGGAMANTFLAAAGLGVGRSLHEPEFNATARRIVTRAEATGCALILPIDAVVAGDLATNAPHRTYGVDAIPTDLMILDLGAQSVAERIIPAIDEAATLIWNGPLGAFEHPPFDAATLAVARHVGERTRAGKLRSVAGGGDTVAALTRAGVADAFSYVSTAGGAFLEWMEGKALPGIEALRRE